jgi:lipoprotein-releasing system permease protein
MFEFFIALKYLIPRKRALSTSIIALLSVFVISLVVWLVLVFLSVTTGIEKNWLQKLVSLNAPIRLAPTSAYYSSYYYQIDSVASASQYTYKTIGEKAIATKTNPYSDEDMETPTSLPRMEKSANGEPLDIVKKTLSILDTTTPKITHQDYEISGALMKLNLRRKEKSDFSLVTEERQSFLSQMTYLESLNDKNPSLSSLLLPPTKNDIENVLQIIEQSSPTHFSSQIAFLFDQVSFLSFTTDPEFSIPLTSLPETSFIAYATIQNGKIHKIILPQKNQIESRFMHFLPGKLEKKNASWVFTSESNTYPVDEKTMIRPERPLLVKAQLIEGSLAKATSLKDILFTLTFTWQNVSFSAPFPFQHLSLSEISFSKSSQASAYPLWSVVQNNSIQLGERENYFPVLLPKSFQSSGVLIGDSGYFAYTSTSGLASQEKHIPFFVSGFYDPGILPLGNRLLLVPYAVTRTINAAVSTFSPDGTPTNGIYVWFSPFSKADEIQKRILEKLQAAKLSPYWSVTTYKDYEFSKDLLEQFQSDRLLFTLLAVIILVVACSNIISLLILLVNDKKKEIATLQSMGASRRSIAIIFGACGVTMGLCSSLLGTLAAIFTLHHLDVLISFLSAIQGHAAFNEAFFGKTLPNTLSYDSLLFVFIVTPILSLLAGLIPALKACRICPSQILRSE